MTEPVRTARRQKQAEKASAAEEEVAGAILLVLAGQVVVASVAAAIASLLALLPDVAKLESPVADSVARLVSRDTPRLSEASGATRDAYLDNLSRRAHYAISAVKRIGQDVAGGTSLVEAIEKEAHNLSLHLERSARAVAAGKATDAMVALHGPLLSWNHAATGEPEEPRPAHIAADGANFDVRRGTPVSTGALPGVEPGCTCAWGVPIQGARTLT